jgi:uracil-DNA glycosylase family 4
MTDRADLAEHLKFFAELGVTGVSRDPAWRERSDGPAGLRPGHPKPAEDSTGGLPASSTGGERPVPQDADTDSASTLQDLRAYIGPDCTRCKLGGLGRRQVVFGVGNPHAALMFVGEAPGADEDAQGEPFVGRAGQLLTKIIEAMDLKREDVYIANVIKCRPPGNRAPEPDEVATCEPFLMQQIDAIAPRVIVALGTHAAHALLKTDAPISRLRGRVHEFRGGIKLVPTFHPAFLLRSPDRKRDVWEDMKKVRSLLAEPPH